jgi:hypothetical protein
MGLQHRYAPRLEALEDRLLLAKVTWVAAAGFWDVAGNWRSISACPAGAGRR